MALPTSFYSASIADNTRKTNGDPESGNYRFPITTITPANLAAVQTAIATFRGAVAALVLGNLFKYEIIAQVTETAKTPAASQLAQRENKFLVRFHDSTTGQKASVSIPTADLSKLTANSEFVDITAGDGLAFKNAFEAIAVSPYDASHSVVVDSVQFVGRNR